MSTIAKVAEQFERDAEAVRGQLAGRVAIAGVSLFVALTIAYAVVSGLTSAGVLGA